MSGGPSFVGSLSLVGSSTDGVFASGMISGNGFRGTAALPALPYAVPIAVSASLAALSRIFTTLATQISRALLSTACQKPSVPGSPNAAPVRVNVRSAMALVVPTSSFVVPLVLASQCAHPGDTASFAVTFTVAPLSPSLIASETALVGQASDDAHHSWKPFHSAEICVSRVVLHGVRTELTSASRIIRLSASISLRNASSRARRAFAELPCQSPSSSPMPFTHSVPILVIQPSRKVVNSVRLVAALPKTAGSSRSFALIVPSMKRSSGALLAVQAANLAPAPSRFG